MGERAERAERAEGAEGAEGSGRDVAQGLRRFLSLAAMPEQQTPKLGASGFNGSSALKPSSRGSAMALVSTGQPAGTQSTLSGLDGGLRSIPWSGLDSLLSVACSRQDALEAQPKKHAEKLTNCKTWFWGLGEIRTCHRAGPKGAGEEPADPARDSVAGFGVPSYVHVVLLQTSTLA